MLIDVTRDATAQLHGIGRLDAALLTHAHRDASGGIPALRRRDGDASPLPVFAHAKTLAALERRYARLDHCDLIPVAAGTTIRFGAWRLGAIEVPHAADPATPTLAWKVVTGDGVLVYASDVARPTRRLAHFARGASALVVDGATFGRTIFTHLRIDRDLPTICAWDVERIFLTQIGRSVPDHAELERVAAGLCPRARPAHDGLVVDLARPRRGAV